MAVVPSDQGIKRSGVSLAGEAEKFTVDSLDQPGAFPPLWLVFVRSGLFSSQLTASSSLSEP
jgi:hypothetical protein